MLLELVKVIENVFLNPKYSRLKNTANSMLNH